MDAPQQLEETLKKPSSLTAFDLFGPH